MNRTTIDSAELDKFAKLSQSWWDETGPFRQLHLMNPLRIGYIKDHVTIADKKILDVGCGGGILSVPLHRLGAEVVGLDAELQNIKIAESYASIHDYNIKYVCDSIENFQQEKFDIVCALEILEHVSDVPLFIKSLCNVVADDGLIFISTINKTIKSYLKTILAAEYILKMVPIGTHEWNKFIKPSLIYNLLDQNNFDIIDISGMHYNPFLSQWYLNKDVSSNYIMVAKKRPSAG